MKQNLLLFSLLLSMSLMVFSCQKEEFQTEDEVPQEVISKLKSMGFNPDGILKMDYGYLIERDIMITHEFLNSPITEHRVPGAEQYRTNNLVTTNGSRAITVFLPTGNGGFSNKYSRALNFVIQAYNNEGLELTFQRVNNAGAADIVFSRLSAFEEFIGILGSAGFPTASGDPFNEIRLSGRISFNIGGLATVMAHEMGHCIGFRHTDYFDRSISCGGAPDNEGDGGVGAVYIPGTPTGADLQGNGSWMLSCTDGSTRRFTSGDKTALAVLY